MRDTLFISHATPQDNDFAIWLASRLEMLGYKTWIDKNGLLGGEKFWQTIQNVIKDDAIKILFVYSANIRDANDNLKDGIDKELSYAESIASQEKINDFIIPLHIDNSQFNAFIGSNRLNHIPFNESWAEGLKQLLKKLEKDNIPKVTDINESSFSEWYEKEYISDCSIINKTELYYTSWWQIAEIPQQFYMYLFDNLEQAKVIRNLNKNIPISLLSNVLSSFDNNLNFCVERDNEQFDVLPQNTYSFTLSKILNGFESNIFPQSRDVENHFKRFLHCVISNLFRQKGRQKAKLSGRKFAYFRPKYNEKESVSFFYPFSSQKKPKRKQIFGRFGKIGFWHYAVSPKTILFPFVGFSLKSHIVFTTNGVQLITDEKKVHAYRRKKGKRFFNKEWRDLYIAFLQGLKDDDGEIKVTSNDEYVKMKEYPENFWSEVGYNDPKTYMSLAKVENYVEETGEEIE
jgi:hypothetical protein